MLSVTPLGGRILKIFLPLKTGAAFCDNKMKIQSTYLLNSAAPTQFLTKTKLLEPHYLVTRFPRLVLVIHMDGGRQPILFYIVTRRSVLPEEGHLDI